MAVCCVSVLELKSNSGYFLSLIYMCAEEFKAQMSTRNIFMSHFTVDNYGIFIFLNQEMVKLV